MSEFLSQVLREVNSHFTEAKPVVKLQPETFPVADPNEKYQELFREAMRGEGDFWPKGASSYGYGNGPKWDNEQELAMFDALCRAVRMPGTPAEKWERLERALRNTVHVYADANS